MKLLWDQRTFPKATRRPWGPICLFFCVCSLFCCCGRPCAQHCPSISVFRDDPWCSFKYWIGSFPSSSLLHFSDREAPPELILPGTTPSFLPLSHLHTLPPFIPWANAGHQPRQALCWACKGREGSTPSGEKGSERATEPQKQGLIISPWERESTEQRTMAEMITAYQESRRRVM